MPVGLVIFEVAHPLPRFEVNYSLAFPLIGHEIAFIFLPIVSLHSDKGIVRLILLISFAHYVGIPVILNTSAMKFPTFEFSFISDPLLVPVQFAIPIHLSFNPVAKIELAIVILIVSFPLSVWFFIGGALPY